MADKTWVATDLVLGKLTLHRTTDEYGQPAIQHESRYQFLGTDGEVLTQIAGGRVLDVIALTDIPADILAALRKIDVWRKNKALMKEGMA